MTQRVIAFTGISGVGKTTFLRSLARALPFQHLTGGSLIVAGREADLECRDGMRHQDLDENQRLLIEGFAVVRDPEADQIFMDGHVIIDDGKSLTKLECDVFRALDIAMMVHLEAEPKQIASNRSHDASRSRPSYDVETLERHQDISRLHAKFIANELNVDFHVVTHEDVDHLASLLRNPS